MIMSRDLMALDIIQIHRLFFLNKIVDFIEFVIGFKAMNKMDRTRKSELKKFACLFWNQNSYELSQFFIESRFRFLVSVQSNHCTAGNATSSLRTRSRSGCKISATVPKSLKIFAMESIDAANLKRAVVEVGFI